MIKKITTVYLLSISLSLSANDKISRTSTEAYIVKQCQNHFHSERMVWGTSTINYREVYFSGDVFVLDYISTSKYSDSHMLGGSESIVKGVVQVNLFGVSNKVSNKGDAVILLCTDQKVCFSSEATDQYGIDNEGRGTIDFEPKVWFYCRNPERVTKAFEHLLSLIDDEEHLF